MDLGIILLFIASGMLSGVLAGLLGIGGGIVTVPVLYYLLSFAGIPDDRVMQVAISTSLAATFLTAFSSTWAHHQKKNVHFSTLKYLIPGLAIGCVSGALTAHLVPSVFLREFFGIAAILFGIYFFFPRLPHLYIAPHPNFTLGFFGLAIGYLSSLLGIGGGIFTIPILFGYSVPMKNTIATSSASTLATALVGSLTYLVIAWYKPSLPETFGYIELPAFLSIGITSIFFAPIGVKLSHHLPTSLIQRIFASALALTGLSMLFH